jgi:signal transduction histidine kinase
VRANNHLHGVLHLMRLEGSGAFGPEVEEVAERVLDEAARLRRQAELAALRAELDQLVRELTGAPADALTAALPGRLEAHLRRALGRSCAVAVRAREGGRALFSCASTALSSTDLDELEALSAALGAAEDRRARPAHAGRGALGRGAALALPITLGSDPDLHGHLFVLRPPDFDAEDAERARELARAVALLLEGEALRSRWKLQAGLFRHALLGPAQGLQSAARKLALLARLPDPPLAEVDEADQRVQIESAALRTWQRNQRALAMVQAGQPPDLRPRDAALRPLLERCARRYEAAFAERGASLRWAWGTGTGLRFPFDEDALDVMFTNLLDNASKYGFYNRPVTVGVEVDGPAVAVWVESLGAAIPQGVAQGLYLPGARLAARDPLRAIHGEGLGLFLVGLLATAAGGEVSHACAPEGEDRGPTSPHRVRFTLRLPHRWTARKPRPG